MKRFARTETTTRGSTPKMKLKHRIECIERQMRSTPAGLKAVIQGFVDPSVAGDSVYTPAALASDDARLQQGIDADGEGVISQWWSVTFFDGTKEQQETRLKELRADPRYQKPCAEGEPHAYFEGGARCDDVYLHLHKKNNRLTERMNQHNLEYQQIRCLTDQRN